MTIPRCWICGGMLACMLLFTSSARGQAVWTEHTLHLVTSHLMDVSIRGDSVGIVQARDRLVSLLEAQPVAARAHYLYAFANWQLSLLTFNDNAAAIRLLDEAIRHLEDAVALHDEYADAYVLWIRCNYWLSQLDADRRDALMIKNRDLLRKARAVAPENPRVVLDEAIALFYTPPENGGRRERGLARLQEAFRIFEQQPDDDAFETWWHATAYNWLGQIYLGMGDPEKARDAFQQALILRPDFTSVRRSMRICPVNYPLRFFQ